MASNFTVRVKNTFIDDWDDDSSEDEAAIACRRAVCTCPSFLGPREPEPELSPSLPHVEPAFPEVLGPRAAAAEGVDILFRLMAAAKAEGADEVQRAGATAAREPEPELAPSRKSAAASPAERTPAPAFASAADDALTAEGAGLGLLARLLGRPPSAPEEPAAERPAWTPAPPPAQEVPAFASAADDALTAEGSGLGVLARLLGRPPLAPEEPAAESPASTPAPPPAEEAPVLAPVAEQAAPAEDAGLSVLARLLGRPVAGAGCAGSLSADRHAPAQCGSPVEALPGMGGVDGEPKSDMLRTLLGVLKSERPALLGPAEAAVEEPEQPAPEEERPAREEPERPALGEPRAVGGGLVLSSVGLRGCDGDEEDLSGPAGLAGAWESYALGEEDLTSPAVQLAVVECSRGADAASPSCGPTRGAVQPRASKRGQWRQQLATTQEAEEAEESGGPTFTPCPEDASPWPATPSVEQAAEEARPRRGGRCRAKLWCHFYLSTEMLRPGFDLNKKVIGRGGCCTRGIFDATGCKVRLRGRGSGHFEVGGRREAPVHLMLAVTAESGDSENFTEAIRKAIDLLRGIEGRFRGFCRQRRLPAPAEGCFWVGDIAAEGCECLDLATEGLPAALAASVKNGADTWFADW